MVWLLLWLMVWDRWRAVRKSETVSDSLKTIMHSLTLLLSREEHVHISLSFFLLLIVLVSLWLLLIMERIRMECNLPSCIHSCINLSESVMYASTRLSFNILYTIIPPSSPLPLLLLLLLLLFSGVYKHLTNAWEPYTPILYRHACTITCNWL